MRIGIVTQAYYPVLGGVTEHVFHLGRELTRRGHEVTIITGAAKHPDDRGLRVKRLGFQVPLTMNGANMHMTLGWKLGRALQRIEEHEHFDIVHIQSPVDPGLPLIASKTMRSLKIGTHHSFRDNHTVADAAFRLFRGSFNDAVGKLRANIAVSPSAAAICHRYYPNVPITIIPNGIDVNRFSPDVQPIPIRRGQEFLILFVGRMDPRKGAKYLFAAIPHLEASLSDYRVVVVGSGWMKKYYNAHIPVHLLRRVLFAGFASPEELPSYYRAADVYCSPATGNESFGIVLLEAMASGIPIVASDIDGYRHVITTGVEGFLVPPRYPRALAAALVMMAQDPERRSQMGRAGRATAQRYDWKLITNQVLDVYHQVIQKS